MKKKMTLNTYCYDCGHLFINFSFFELLGKFYCFIMKRKNAPMPILETELTDILANDHFKSTNVQSCKEGTGAPNEDIVQNHLT